MSHFRRFAPAVLALVVVSCGDPAGPSPKGTTDPVATALAVTREASGASSGAAFTTQPIVEIRSAAGARVSSSAQVTASIGSGSGTLTGTTTVTAAGGVATFTNLGVSGTGAHTLTFTATGLASATSAVIEVAPPPPASISVGSAVAVLTTGSTAVATASTKDASNATLAGVPVEWTSRSPSVVSVNSAGTLTAVARGQAIVVVNPVGFASVRDSMLVVVGDADSPLLITDLAQLSLKRDTMFTISLYVDMRAMTTKVGAATIDVAWQPSLLVYQSSTAVAAVGATVNTSATSTGLLRLTFANPSGFGGKVEILQVTFRAGATPGTSGALTLTASEMSATDYSSLMPKLVQVSSPVVIR